MDKRQFAVSMIVALVASFQCDGDARASEKPPYDKRISLTLSPIHLALPVVEITGEGRVADKLGGAGIVGVGKIQSVVAWELGAQGRYYVLGSFDHGLELGAEALYVSASTQSSGASAQASGVAAGPFLGYKIAARFGLTFDAQLGVEYQFLAAQAESGGVSQSASDKGLIPLLNINVGWSI